MPRPPDPGLEERILKAAEVLWKRGGERALTMRAVAQVAGTNTPAVYRRFKDRDELLRALLLRIAGRIRQYFEQGETLEGMADAYVESALKLPREYQLFYSHGSLLNPPRRRGSPVPIRESRPNFASAEQVAAKQLGGSPEDHTQFVLCLWALVHGTATLLLSGTIPSGHEAELRAACRTGVKSLIRGVKSKS
jgi:AcrR family transcriptional regulator